MGSVGGMNGHCVVTTIVVTILFLYKTWHVQRDE